MELLDTALPDLDGGGAGRRGSSRQQQGVRLPDEVAPGEPRRERIGTGREPPGPGEVLGIILDVLCSLGCPDLIFGAYQSRYRQRGKYPCFLAVVTGYLLAGRLTQLPTTVLKDIVESSGASRCVGG